MIVKLVKQLRAFFDFALDDRSVRIGRLICRGIGH